MSLFPARRCRQQIERGRRLFAKGLIALFLFAFTALPALEQSERFRLQAPQALSPALHKTLELLENRCQDFEMEMGIYPGGQLKIQVLSARDFEIISRSGAEIIENSQAFYSAADTTIYIRSIDQVQENYLKILMHEYLHWYLEALFENAPLWFHEGMATYYAGQMSYERYLMYLKNSFWGKKSNLFRLSYSYPTRAEDWHYFYEASAMALRFMKEKYPTAWQSFWTEIAYQHRSGNKTDFNAAFIRNYNQSLYDFHLAFETHSKKQGYLYLAVGVNSVVFLMAALLVPVGTLRRKRRLMEMEMEEEMEDDL